MGIDSFFFRPVEVIGRLEGGTEESAYPASRLFDKKPDLRTRTTNTTGVILEWDFNSTYSVTLTAAAAVNLGGTTNRVRIPINGSHVFKTFHYVTIASTTFYNGTFMVQDYGEDWIDIEVAFNAETFGGAETCIIAINTLGIINHNVASGQTVTIQADNDGTHPGSAVTTFTTPRDAINHPVMWVNFSDTNNRYYYADFTALQTYSDSYFEFGQIIAGYRIPFKKNFGVISENYDVANIKTVMKNGSVYRIKKSVTRSFNLTFNNIDLAAKTQVETLYTELEGGVEPFALMLNENENSGVNTEFYYGFFSGALKMSRKSNNFFQLGLPFTEMPFGAVITKRSA